MVTRSNLDALSPGMMAKLDPLSRIVRERKAAQWDSLTRSSSETAFSRHTTSPADRLKRREVLRTRVTGY